MTMASHPTVEVDRSLLAPYLARLDVLAQHRGQDDRATRIAVGGESIVVEPWERGQILLAFEGAGRASRDVPPLIASGVALQTKAYHDLSKRPDADHAVPPGETRDALMHDSVLGNALLGDLQAAVDQLVKRGRVDDARRLTEFRNKLGRAISMVVDALGDEVVAVLAQQRREAALLAKAERLERESEAARLGVGEQRPEGPPDLAAIDAVAVSPRARVGARMKWFVGALVISLAALAGLHLSGILGKHGPEFPILTVADFQTHGPVQEVLARPPSVYVRVDGDAWNRLGVDERQAALEGLSGVVSEAGYNGMHLTTGNGRTVGQWLKNTGSRLIAQGE